MKNLQTTLNLRNKPAEFTNIVNAQSWASKSVKPGMIVLGEEGKFWVVCFSDAQRLVKAGYELAL
jgi:hypothetical protein